MKTLFWVITAFYLAISLGSLTCLEMSFIMMFVFWVLLAATIEYLGLYEAFILDALGIVSNLFIVLFFNFGINSVLFSTMLVDSNPIVSRIFSSRSFIGYLIIGQITMFVVDLAVSYGLWYLCWKKGLFKRIGVMRTNW